MPGVDESQSPVWARATSKLAREGADPRGSFAIYLPTEAVCVTRARGHLSVELARLLPETLAPHLDAARPIALFHDWERMTTYDSGARRLLTSWAIENVRTLKSLEFIVASRVVAMGIAAANVATSLAGLPLVAHTKRAEFEKALARLV